MKKQPIVYGIPNCDTVKKARQWLTDHDIAATFHDFKKQGVPPDHLDQWLASAGWEKLVNRKGTTWRKLTAQAQEGVKDTASARAILLEQPSLIKRPVVEWGTSTTVGFDLATWETLLTKP